MGYDEYGCYYCGSYGAKSGMKMRANRMLMADLGMGLANCVIVVRCQSAIFWVV